jgi:hypothetical protein
MLTIDEKPLTIKINNQEKINTFIKNLDNLNINKELKQSLIEGINN